MDLKLIPSIGAGAMGAAGSALSGAAGIAGAAGQPGVAGVAKGAANFANALESALKSVSQAQNDAGALQRQYQMGVGSVSLEDAMVAMQKAQVGFQAAMTVRNRLVSAYSDIMNMQV
jgi:flagellar hook-basal body complex protein FliE